MRIVSKNVDLPKNLDKIPASAGMTEQRKQQLLKLILGSIIVIEPFMGSNIRMHKALLYEKLFIYVVL
jgi:hypothetical protein